MGAVPIATPDHHDTGQATHHNPSRTPAPPEDKTAPQLDRPVVAGGNMFDVNPGIKNGPDAEGAPHLRRSRSHPGHSHDNRGLA